MNRRLAASTHGDVSGEAAADFEVFMAGGAKEQASSSAARLAVAANGTCSVAAPGGLQRHR